MLLTALRTTGLKKSASSVGTTRFFSTTFSALRDFNVVVVGSGTGGLASASMIKNLFKKEGRKIDIAIIDDAPLHNYQPGWTLVGAGMKTKEELSRPTDSVIPKDFTHINSKVTKIDPKNNKVVTADGEDVGYEELIVASGINVDFDKIKGAQEALDAGAETSGVCSIYSYKYVDQVFPAIQKLKSGTAIFTQPAGAIKCAGAPQKILYLADSYWRKDGARDNIDVKFLTATPAVFGVPQYAGPLKELLAERNVDVGLSTNLVEVDYKTKTAKFAVAEGNTRVEKYDFLHVVPPMSPVKYEGPADLFDSAGFIAVDPHTLRSPTYKNVWAIGDGAGTANSKTAAAITSQAPVLAHNLHRDLATGGKVTGLASYEGYASCPITTSDSQVLLAEFGYGGKPMESFKALLGIDQTVPRTMFMYLVKYLFPYVYFKYLLNGTWYGRTGFIPPKFVDAIEPPHIEPPKN